MRFFTSCDIFSLFAIAKLWNNEEIYLYKCWYTYEQDSIVQIQTYRTAIVEYEWMSQVEASKD